LGEVRSSPSSSFGSYALFLCHLSFLEVSLSFGQRPDSWPSKSGSKFNVVGIELPGKVHNCMEVGLSMRLEGYNRFHSFNFWKELSVGLGTKLAFSTIYHPQTYGSTKRVNRILEDMLRMYVMDQ